MKIIRLSVQIDSKHSLNAEFDISQKTFRKNILKFIFDEVKKFIEESENIENREQEMST